MANSHFTITIKAPIQRVWNTMIGKDTYPKRTAAFNPHGSRFEGDRSAGSEMRFIGPHPEHPDQFGGILSKVAANKQFVFISLQHIAEIQNGVVQEGVRKDAFENYSFSEQDGNTVLDVDLKMPELMAGMEDYMNQTWPKALDLLKELCETPFEKITISTSVYASLENVWAKWNTPADITQWCSGHESWHTTRAENDLHTGGRFLTRMEAKDGSAGFDWCGTYTKVEPMSLIEYTMDDGRTCSVHFVGDESCGTTTITETFEAETVNSLDMQKEGRGHILSNFKNYVEGK